MFPFPPRRASTLLELGRTACPSVSATPSSSPSVGPPLEVLYRTRPYVPPLMSNCLRVRPVALPARELPVPRQLLTHLGFLSVASRTRSAPRHHRSNSAIANIVASIIAHARASRGVVRMTSLPAHWNSWPMAERAGVSYRRFSSGSSRAYAGRYIRRSITPAGVGSGRNEPRRFGVPANPPIPP